MARGGIHTIRDSNGRLKDIGDEKWEGDGASIYIGTRAGNPMAIDFATIQNRLEGQGFIGFEVNWSFQVIEGDKVIPQNELSFFQKRWIIYT